MFMFRHLIVLALIAAHAGIAHAASWTHDAYVWQRQHSPALEASLLAPRNYINAYCILASEISWHKGAPQINRPRIDYTKLAALENPVGLALRIGTITSEKQFSDTLSRIVAEAAFVLKTARDAGLDPAELQIDFDCPESKLPFYRDWLAALKTAAGKTPLTFTALPCWLRHEREFIALARSADDFVLQVHSLHKPGHIDYAFTLCAPDQALQWTREADALATRAGVNFRIALPTYGYTLGFDTKGRFIGLAAETPRDWPAGTQLRNVRSAPFELQRLAQKLAAEKLARATGIIWFRLPVDGDRLAWNEETFSAVIGNETIASQLAIEIHRTQPELAEIVIINRGQTIETLPENLRVKWTCGIHPDAWDGLGGYYFYNDPEDASSFRITRSLAPSEIRPGRSRAIGWMRFDFSKSTTNEPFSIHATIP